LEEIDVSEGEDVAWIKGQNDPFLWHQAAMAAVAYRGDRQNFLPWLLQQPDMDRATAGWIFLWGEGSRYLRGYKDWMLDHFSGEEFTRLLGAVCQRSESIGFRRDEIGLHPDFDAERQACLQVVADGEVAPGIIVPHNIIARPFASERQDRRYVIDDGIILVEG
jgi:hypothetical protein